MSTRSHKPLEIWRFQILHNRFHLYKRWMTSNQSGLPRWWSRNRRALGRGEARCPSRTRDTSTVGSSCHPSSAGWSSVQSQTRLVSGHVKLSDTSVLWKLTLAASDIYKSKVTSYDKRNKRFFLQGRWEVEVTKNSRVDIPHQIHIKLHTKSIKSKK
jgi:hypothetical protein